MARAGNRLKNEGAELAGKRKQSTGPSIGTRQMGTMGYAREPTGEFSQNAFHVAERTDTARRTDLEGMQSSDDPNVGPAGYDAFEADFRGHHQTNAAHRRGPYEHYRLVYRYGYDLGTDPRYRRADWSSVERDARPRWEERNPGTWEEFKETIRYAWDKARGRR